MGTVETGRHWPGYGISGPAAISFPQSRREGDGVKEHRASFHPDNASRDSLPSIGYLDLESAGKDTPRHPPKFPAMATGLSVSTGPLASPTSASYPSQPPYGYSSSSATSGPPPPGSAYPSPTDARRPGEDDKEQQPHNPPQHIPPRQSLPSIHEALGNDNLPYPPASAAPSKPGHPPASGPISSSIISRPSLDGPTGPPNPFSNGSTPFLRENPFGAHQTTPAGQPQPEGPRASLASIHSQESRNPSIPSLSSGKSPTQSSRNGAPSLTNSQSSAYEFSGPVSGGTMSSPTNYAPYSQSVPYGSQAPPNAPSSLPYPSGPYETRPSLGPAWNQNPVDAARMDEMQRSTRTANGVGAPHSESVKRQLEGYDVEASYHEIIESSGRAIEFARHYGAKAHQSNRSGSVIGSIPPLAEVDEMIQVARRKSEALARIRNLAEHALAEQQAEQRAQRQVFKHDGPYGEEPPAVYQEEFKGGGGFAGGDAKKRRGKAAPPGRCHSCNRAETPEWRRGPDGARTLCNACGLHYAKLTRKMAGNKPSSLGPNIRPKSGVDSRSPTH
ncbi:hypothetical protein FQN55_002646 [Onygenales sp. PD_40]|nr:hypothetical protein FQN55_002646 [Onygenales sp. PD_40]KAK2804960.1 hypothetical protein FQN51_001053 [Onygenales sp. PD_10]